MEEGPKLRDGSIDIFVLPGGRSPERKTGGAIGYDVYARALVSRTKQDKIDPRFRKTLFDFQMRPKNAWMRQHIRRDPDDREKLAFKLKPGEHVLIGVGFSTALPDRMMIWLTPRSGLSMRRLTLTNAPGTIDPDYRGEAGALLVNQSKKDFLLQHQMRIAQIVFCPVYLPELAIKASMDELGDTTRSGGGFGSTGLRD
jgi:dUTP pyrophosphatase